MPYHLSESDKKDWELYLQKTFNSRDISFPIYKEEISLPTRLDLHGMTIQEAFHRFAQFVEAHVEAGSNSVVIITGKSGQISKEFQDWCRRNPKIKKWEAQVDTRGGVGSYRVYIRS